MNVEYEFTKDDYSAFNLYHHCQSPTARCQYYRLWFTPAIILVIGSIILWYLTYLKGADPLQAIIHLSPLFCAAPFYLIYFPWAYRRKLRKIVTSMVSEGHNRGLFNRHHVTISPDGVSVFGVFGQSLTTWQTVERVVQNGDYAFIYINAMAAIVVPRRAFTNPTEFEEFIRRANDYHKNALA